MSIISYVLPGATVPQKRRSRASSDFPPVDPAEAAEAPLPQRDPSADRHTGSAEQNALLALMEREANTPLIGQPAPEAGSLAPALPRLFGEPGPHPQSRHDPHLAKLFSSGSESGARISKRC